MHLLVKLVCSFWFWLDIALSVTGGIIVWWGLKIEKRAEKLMVPESFKPDLFEDVMAAQKAELDRGWRILMFGIVFEVLAAFGISVISGLEIADLNEKTANLQSSNLVLRLQLLELEKQILEARPENQPISRFEVILTLDISFAYDRKQDIFLPFECAPIGGSVGKMRLNATNGQIVLVADSVGLSRRNDPRPNFVELTAIFHGEFPNLAGAFMERRVESINSLGSFVLQLNCRIPAGTTVMSGTFAAIANTTTRSVGISQGKFAETMLFTSTNGIFLITPP